MAEYRRRDCGKYTPATDVRQKQCNRSRRTWPKSPVTALYWPRRHNFDPRKLPRPEDAFLRLFEQMGQQDRWVMKARMAGLSKAKRKAD